MAGTVILMLSNICGSTGELKAHSSIDPLARELSVRVKIESF